MQRVKTKILIHASADRVFDTFCELGAWWPMAYTFSGALFETAGIDRTIGGQWYEVDANGAKTSWGDVRGFEDGRRLILGFGIGADRQPTKPEQASEVELSFMPVEGGTWVEVEHRDFSRHGEQAEMIRSGMESSNGWPMILSELRRAVRRIDKGL